MFLRIARTALLVLRSHLRPFMQSPQFVSHNHNCIFKMWADYRLSSTGASRQTRTNAMRQSETPSATSNPSYNLRSQNQREHYYEREDAQMTPRHRTTMNRSRSRQRPISGRAHQSRSQSRRRHPVSTTYGHHSKDWLTRRSNGMGYPNWALIAIATLTSVLAILLAYRNTNIWQYVAVLGSLLQWASTYLTRSLDQVSPGLTTSLCKMPAVPWVLDCGLPNTAKPDIIVNQRNLNRLSDAVKALVETPDHLTRATHVVDEVRRVGRELLPLSMNLPYSATFTLVKQVNILLVQIPSYERDIDTNLRLISYTATQLLHKSSKGTQADGSVPSREPWRGVGTIWGGFHNQVVTHFSIFITEFAKMHHKSEMLLLLCQTMSDGLETLRIETEQSQSNQAEIEQANKAIRFWKSSTTLNRDSTHALKMISHLSSVVENALDLLRKNHSAAETALASLRAAKRNIIAGKPDWRVLIGKRARHIPATLVDLEEARKLSLELLAYRIILRDKADPDYHSQMSKIRAGHGLH